MKKTFPPLATHDFNSGDLDAALLFLKRTRSELRTLRRVRVWRDRTQVIDVNNDCFEITGQGYTSSEIMNLLDAIDAVYKPEQIHDEIETDFKEFMTGRRYPWAQDRVM
ncbi:MAG: hypothetical protein O3A00_02315 [Planctomycetota bacterium]|nr:hypothetical protein [Planctomycetota bacterium]